MDELLSQFLIEARELAALVADDLAILERQPDDAARIDSAFRAIHTLKGSVAIFDMAPAGRLLHAAEDLLERARAGTQPLVQREIATLLSVIDHIERWIDAMERDGALPAASAGEADRVISRFDTAGGAVRPSAAAPGVDPWLEAMVEREAETIDESAGEFVAFRYVPDAECFFTGDDPLAIVAKVAELRALRIAPTAAWPALADLEPFACAVVLEGISAAPLDEVRAAFRFVSSQVRVASVPSRARGMPGEAGSAAGLSRSMRVDPSRIDALADGVGELTVAINALSLVIADADRIDRAIGARLRTVQTNLDRAVGDMRQAVVAVRKVSLAPTLQRLPRMVREISEALGKSVRLETSGETTEVDKAVADALFEPLLHIVRNAIDHGIEKPAERRAAGKPETGMLRLAVFRDGDQVIVSLTDDGAGMDAARLRDVAVTRGVLDRAAADALGEADALRLIFAPGFSTADTVSAVSGRGVGMDAVRTAIENLGGGVELDSWRGEGSTIGLRLPLNAILTRLLIVNVADAQYGVPLDSIVETASIASERIIAIGGGRACVLRERTLPILSLAALLGGTEAQAPRARLLVTAASSEPVGLTVDGFAGRIDGLVRPRSGLLAGIPGIAGTTMLGDGGILLVLDLAELVA